MVAAAYKPLAAKEAKERQLATLKQNAGSVPAQTPDREKGESRDISAQKFGVGSNYVGRAERVLRKDAGLAEDVKAGKVSLPDAERELGLGRKAGRKGGSDDHMTTDMSGDADEESRHGADLRETQPGPVAVEDVEKDRPTDPDWRVRNSKRLMAIMQYEQTITVAFGALGKLANIVPEDVVKYMNADLRDQVLTDITGHINHLRSIGALLGCA